MQIFVLSGDPVFVSATEAIAGVMGHTVTKTQGPEAVAICDVPTMDSPDVLRALDPMRTVLFVGRASEANSAFLHVYPRTSLAVELPRLLALLADA